MRRIRYLVAMSLDGYIAGPNGEFDWIVQDPEIDFSAMMRQFDTMLVGRKTYEMMAAMGDAAFPRGMKTYVFSRTLSPPERQDVTLVANNFAETVTALRQAPGKDIWLMGGGRLFHALLAIGAVDTVETTVIPVLLGGGIPMLPAPALSMKLRLMNTRVYKKTGSVMLEYAVSERAASPVGVAAEGGR